MFLAGQVLEFRYSGESIIIRVVDHGHRLKLLLVQGFMSEVQTTIRQPPKTELKEFIDRSTIYYFLVRNDVLHMSVIRIEQDFYIWMIQHIFKHPGETIARHGLVRISEITVVPVGPGGHSGCNLSIEFGRIESPLFSCVTAEKFLVEFASDFVDYHVF